jgi:aspartokinase/homoserine dehydrogenase 1
VREAMHRGYTEPDPRIDLSGKDVARKLLILARETGLDAEMKDIQIEQILPPSCQKAKSVQEFLNELEKNNSVFAKRRDKAMKKTRYCGFIASLSNGKAKISLQEVDAMHPFYNLSEVTTLYLSQQKGTTIDH